MSISPEEKRGLILGCIPFVSMVTGILKASEANKNYQVCAKAKDKSELESRIDLTARRLIDTQLAFQEEKSKLLNGYRIEMVYSIIETIPIIGNVISLARALYCYYSLPQPKAITQLASPFAPLQAKKVPIAGKEVYQVKVLNQNQLPGGLVQCGSHAFKNALVSLAVASETEDIDTKAFVDVDQYNALNNYVDTFGVQPPEDVTIAQLMDALEDLHRSPSFLHDTLKPLHTLLQTHFNSISMFNAYQGLVSGSAGGIASLHTLANLKEFYEKPQPKTHAFLFGTDRHWIALMLHIDAAGQETWYGTDSCADTVTLSRFQKAINLLEPIIDNPYPFIKKSYREGVGEEIQHDLALFDEKGELKDIEVLGELAKSCPTFVTKFSRTYDFMQRAGWLSSDDPECRQQVTELKNYVQFYTRALKIANLSDPALNKICEALAVQQTSK